MAGSLLAVQRFVLVLAVHRSLRIVKDGSSGLISVFLVKLHPQLIDDLIFFDVFIHEGVKVTFECHFFVPESQVALPQKSEIVALVFDEFLQKWFSLIIAVFPRSTLKLIILAFFVIVSKVLPKSRFLVAFRLRMALPVFPDRTELSKDFGLLNGEGRLRKVTLAFGLVAIVTLLMAFFALLGGMDSIEYLVGLCLLDVRDEAMYQGIVAIVVDFDHKFIYNLNQLTQKK